MITCFGSSFRQPHLHAGEITPGTLRAWRNAANPTFSVQSWIARELSALRRLWCSLSCGRPRSWWCAGVLLIGVTVLKYSSHLSFHFSLAHFLMIFPRGDYVWLLWCSICEASAALSIMPRVHVSLIAIGVAPGWRFLPLLLLIFPRILVFSSLITSLHLGLSLDFRVIWSSVTNPNWA